MVVQRRFCVAHVTLGLELGGQEKLLVEFARHADRARFDLHAISLTGPGKLADSMIDAGCSVTALEAPAGLTPRLVWRLTQEFRRLDCDVVHTHDDKPLIYGAVAARLAGGRRVIHTQHHGRLPTLSRRQERLVGWISHGIDRFVCVAHDSARQMIVQGVPARRLRVLWNGIDLTRFPARGPQFDGPLVTVARLSPEKDIANLLRAFALVLREDAGARLEIAGDGPCREDLLRLAGQLHLGPHVRFLGEVRDIPALLARASLFVLPSQAEGISLTLLEAMATSLPVVATAVGGTPEVVVNGVTGLLTPPRSPAALARAILTARRDGDSAAALGRAGRARVEAEFDVRNMVRRYEAMYERRGDADLPRRMKRSRAEVPSCAS